MKCAVGVLMKCGDVLSLDFQQKLYKQTDEVLYKQTDERI